MSDNIALELMKLATTVVTLAASAWAAYLAYRAQQFGKANAVKLDEVQTATNGMKDQLVEETRKAAHAEGIQKGMAVEAQRAADAQARRQPDAFP